MEQVGIGVLVLIALVFLILFFRFFGLWIRALMSNAHVSFFNLLGMWLRKVSPAVIVQGRIMSVKAGIDLSTDDLEAHYLAGGNVMNVVRALIAASKANIELIFRKAAAIDLAGRNVLDGQLYGSSRRRYFRMYFKHNWRHEIVAVRDSINRANVN